MGNSWFNDANNTQSNTSNTNHSWNYRGSFYDLEHWIRTCNYCNYIENTHFKTSLEYNKNNNNNNYCFEQNSSYFF